MSLTEGKGFNISPNQKKIWSGNDHRATSGAKTILKITGSLDFKRLSEAFEELKASHDIFSIRFEKVQSLKFPLQYQDDSGSVQMKHCDFSDLTDRQKVNRFQQITGEAGEHPNSPELHLVQWGQDLYYLMLRFPAMLTDSYSILKIAKELFAIYHHSEKVAESIQYLQFSEWQNNLLGEPEEDALLFWERQASAKSPVNSIYLERNAPLANENHSVSVSTSLLGLSVCDKLDQFKEKHGAEELQVLYLCYHLLLFRHKPGTWTTYYLPFHREFEELQDILGPVSKVLPVTLNLSGSENSIETLQLLNQSLEDVIGWQDYFSWENYTDHQNDYPLTFGFEYIDLDEFFGAGEQKNLTFEVRDYHSDTVAFKLKLLCIRRNGRLQLDFYYDPAYFEESSLKILQQQFSTLLESIIELPDAPLATLPMLSSYDDNLISSDFNLPIVKELPGQTVVHLMRETALVNGDRTAVICEDKAWDFSEIESNSNQLANLLNEKFALKAEDTVAILADRSAYSMLAILAILKTGAAFVPIDIDAPSERVKYILKDSGARLLIADSRLQDHTDLTDKTFFLREEWGQVAGYKKILQNQLPGAGDLAYIIYTSGSTGKPKGCMITHKSLCNYINWAKNSYLSDVVEGNFALFTSYAFDFTLTSMFVPLVAGSKLHIFSQKQNLNEIFEEIFSANSIVDTIKLTPAHIHLAEKNLLATANLKVAIVGGEALTKKHIEVLRTINPELTIYNEYGPTEATVGCSVWKVSDETDRILIGRPIDNTCLYIFDKQGEFAPIGTEGEIGVAGYGLSRGYNASTDLPDQRKFVEASFAPGGKIYMTGDYGRFLADGNIIYLGRKDNQVKINGHRIEIEEIERVLLEIPGIREAAVKYFDKDSQFLTAYVVTRNMQDPQSIREALSKYLPKPVIPQYIMIMDALPLTINGKTDREALSDPEFSQTSTAYEAPRSDKEILLAGIWEEVTGREKIGIADNFFELGGDSIKAILISSKLHQSGYSLEVRELFQNPTIRQLAGKLKLKKKKVSQNPVSGKVDLTPIQRDFFHFHQVDRHHYNHAIQLAFEPEFNREDCERIFQELVMHHDALRMVFKIQDEEILQYNQGPLDTIEILEYFPQNDGNNTDYFRQEIDRLQRSIDLEKGPLLKLAIFYLQEKTLLTIVLHHLVIDGVSWRIFLEDIDTLYRKIVLKQDVSLPDKTLSFRDWANSLRAFAGEEVFREQIAFWKDSQNRKFQRWEPDFAGKSNLMKNARKKSFTLDRKETEALLRQVNQAFNTQINDILLTGLGLALSEVFTQRSIPVMLEGHGRQSVKEQADLSRTIGWFTCEYPVTLAISDQDTIGSRIKLIKEGLRQVPANGFGFGLWRHFIKQDSYSIELPQVSFNYLGQFDSDIQNKSFRVANEYLGDIVSPDAQRRYDFELVGMVADEKLHFSITYGSMQYREETASAIIQKFEAGLKDIISYCTAQSEPSLSPSDLTFKGLTIEELEKLSNYHPIEDIYRLSPLQEGLFYQWRLDPSSEAYFNQISFRVTGDLKTEVFERTINYLISRHDMLRTIFIQGHTELPLQMVLRRHKLKVDYEDFSHCSQQELEEKLANKKTDEKHRGFDLMNEVPVRVSVIKESESSFFLIWNIHHIIIDAWCSNILNKEFISVYESFYRSEPVDLPPALPFKKYVQWLSRQQKGEAIQYWKEYLKDYHGNKLLGGKKGNTGFIKRELIFKTNTDLTRKLMSVSQENQVTLNTLLNTIWGIVLYRFSKERDVVFGMIVSGRPPEIEGIEGMMGVTINMLPVRIAWEEEHSFAELLKNIQQQSLDSNQYEYVSLAEIQAASGAGADLISHYVDFHNISSDVYQANESAGILRFESIAGEEQSNYDLQLLISTGKELHFVLRYNEMRFDQNFIEEIRETLLKALITISESIDIKIKELNEALMNEEEKNARKIFSNSLLSKEDEEF